MVEHYNAKVWAAVSSAKPVNIGVVWAMTEPVDADQIPNQIKSALRVSYEKIISVDLEHGIRSQVVYVQNGKVSSQPWYRNDSIERIPYYIVGEPDKEHPGKLELQRAGDTYGRLITIEDFAAKFYRVDLVAVKF